MRALPRPDTLILLAGLGSLGLLAAALTFQVAGYAPCHLCILQRWPHLAAGLIALAALALRARGLAWLGALAAAVAAGLALYHTGVEAGVFAGPSSCTGAGAGIAGLSVQELMAKIEAAPVVRCDEVAWRFLGLSMAAWNALASLGLVAVWGAAAVRR